MAAACYEGKVGEVLMASGMACGKQGGPPALLQDYTDLQLSRDSVLNVVAAAAAAASGAATPALTSLTSLTSLSPVGLHTPIPSGSTGTTVLPGPSTAYKDYSQPLHVDCSVEYELPSQAKPPPGNGEPLLMIHPCYYRRAERERRTLFVNNLPPRTGSSSASSSSSSRRSSKSRAASGAAAGVPAQAVSQQPTLSGLTGMVVNPVMPVAAAAIAASVQQPTNLAAGAPVAIVAPMHRSNSNALSSGPLLPSPSLASIVAASTDAHNAAAAATYHAALTAALGTSHHPEAKQQQQHQPQQHQHQHQHQHQQPQTQLPAPTTELDEKMLAGLYPQYFRNVQRQPQVPQPPPPQTQLHHRHHSHQHHQQQQQQQQQQQGNVDAAAAAAAAAAILHQAYPTQPQQQPQPQPPQQPQPQQHAQQPLPTSSYGMAMMAAPSQRHLHQQTIVGSTATPTILGHHPYRRTSTNGSISSQLRSNVKHSSASSVALSSSSSSGVSSSLPTGSASSYMSNMYASALHRHHHHSAIHALQATHGGFYEAPIYHALLPQS